MCIGIPGQIVEILDAKTDSAIVEIASVRRAVNIACLLDETHGHGDCVGDWVLVHAGFAMNRIDAEEAGKTLRLLEELGELAAREQTRNPL